MKSFLFEYNFRGQTYAGTLDAEDYNDAEARLFAITQGATLLGSVQATIKVDEKGMEIPVMRIFRESSDAMLEVLLKLFKYEGQKLYKHTILPTGVPTQVVYSLTILDKLEIFGWEQFRDFFEDELSKRYGSPKQAADKAVEWLDRECHRGYLKWGFVHGGVWDGLYIKDDGDSGRNRGLQTKDYPSLICLALESGWEG